jgi:hypothetical protein
MFLYSDGGARERPEAFSQIVRKAVKATDNTDL